METQKFKTNIKCAACVEKVTPGLNETIGKDKWSVDLTDPKRILTITAGDAAAMATKLKEVGYSAEKI
jgi:hypothetical protein